MATTSTFDQIILVGSDCIYVVRSSSLGGNTVNWIGRWDGGADTIAPVGGGLTGISLAVCRGASDNQIYVGGGITSTADSTVSLNRVAYYNGSNWSNLGITNWFTEDVTGVVYDPVGNKLYTASHGTTATEKRISLYDGSNWSGISTSFTVSTYAKLALDANQDLYVGYSSTLRKYDSSEGTWSLISSSIGGSINDLEYDPVNNRVYIALGSGSPTAKYYDVQANNIVSMTNLTGTVYSVTADTSGGVYYSTWPSSGYVASIVKYNFGNSSWENLFNFQSVSGVLNLTIDSNGNIFGFGNSGGLNFGVPPYGVGNWQNFSSSSTCNIGGIPSYSSSGETYQETGSGGVQLSGSSSVKGVFSKTSNGGTVCSGSSNVQATFQIAFSGGVICNGSNSFYKQINETSSGGVGLSGTSITTVRHNNSGNGGVGLSGISIVKAEYNHTPSNSTAVLTGTSKYNSLYRMQSEGGVTAYSDNLFFRQIYSSESNGGCVVAGTSIEFLQTAVTGGCICGGTAKIYTFSPAGFSCWSENEQKFIRPEYVRSSARKFFKNDLKGAMVAAITVCEMGVNKKIRD